MSDKAKSTLQAMVETLSDDKTMTAKQIKILEAAIELISEKGYAATSTSEIAKRAGVAEGTIFRHYHTKKDLLVAVVKPVSTNFAARFVEDVFHESYANFEDLLYVFIKNRFEFAQANLPLVKILLQELAFHPDIQITYKNLFAEKVYPALDRSLNVYKEKGQLQQIPNESIIRMIVPTILGFMITRFLIQPNLDWDDEAEFRRTISFIMKGIGKGSA